MTPADRPRLSRALLVLSETFNEPISEVRAEAYFVALADIDIDVIELAVRHALRSCAFFPKPVELRNLVSGSLEDRAELAWAEVLKEVRRVGWCGKPVLTAEAEAAVNAIWGGWVPLCEQLPADGPELIGWAKRFKATYGAVESRASRQSLPSGMGKALAELAESKSWQ